MKRDFAEWLLTFTDSIANYRYYIDFETIYKNAETYKVELNMLNSLIGSKNIENDFEKLIDKYPEVIKSFTILFTVALATYIILILSTTVLGFTPKLVTKINDAFKDIEGWIIKISTPAAAVAVCSGALMRKFSFGDEEKIRTGKKLITGSLFSYAFILAIDLILSAIQSLIG